MWIIITVLIGAIGGLIAIRLKVPAGAIIGSMIAVVLFNICTGKAIFPQEFRILTQIATGAYIGSRICKKDVYELKTIILPAIVLTIIMCAFNITMSIFLSHNTSIDLITALFATAPSGLTDMTLISVDFGADSSKVAALQLVRLISVIIIMPSLIKYSISKKSSNESSDETSKKTDDSMDMNNDSKEYFKRTVYTLMVAFSFGFVGYSLDIPAGAISLSMLACAFYSIKTSKAYMSMKLRKRIQVLGGCLIGARITMTQVLEMKELLPAVIIVIVGYIILNYFLAFLITKLSTIDITTALYASAAGGLTDMAIIAGEMGADAPKVAALQFVRVVTVVAFYPIIFGFF